MFDLGMQELIVIFIVALLVFGPKRLPELGKSLGKGLAELKKAMQGVKDQMDAELEDGTGKENPEKKNEQKTAENAEAGDSPRDAGKHDKGGKA
ncbi:MAG TPA: Sec-independent protein translocase protein TatB [Dissulfurispiraceae bacterium]